MPAHCDVRIRSANKRISGQICHNELVALCSCSIKMLWKEKRHLSHRTFGDYAVSLSITFLYV